MKSMHEWVLVIIKFLNKSTTIIIKTESLINAILELWLA